MLFIYPMWESETQRLGKQKCTALGYALHVIAELAGFIGLLLLLGVGAYLGYRRIVSTFQMSLLWLLVIPFALGIISEALYVTSWVLAFKRGFKYDYETREASWTEDGKQVTYKWQPAQPR